MKFTQYIYKNNQVVTIYRDIIKKLYERKQVKLFITLKITILKKVKLLNLQNSNTRRKISLFFDCNVGPRFRFQSIESTEVGKLIHTKVCRYDW